MEAIILAGGLGTRLRSVVSEVPKCMAPVAGLPFLKYLLDSLKSASASNPAASNPTANTPATCNPTANNAITRVVLSVGYLREIVMDWVEANKQDYPFTFDYAVEETPLGTGGGIRLALEKCREDDVLILNGDTYFNADLGALADFHREKQGAISITLKPMRNFERYGNVLTEGDRITEFKEKAPCEKGLINGGIYMVSRSRLEPVFSSLPEKFSFETAVLPTVTAQGSCNGLVQDCYFIDIGIPEDYERAQRELPELQQNIALPREVLSCGCETLLLDRDGVINRQIVGDYVRTPEQFEFLPGVLEMLKAFNEAGSTGSNGTKDSNGANPQIKHIIIVTNQRGVGKGLMTMEDLGSVHAYMQDEIRAHGGRIDAIYVSTGLTDLDPTRKPNPGMFIKARRDFPDINPETTVMIGDSDSDMEFAENCGIRGIRIKKY